MKIHRNKKYAFFYPINIHQRKTIPVIYIYSPLFIAIYSDTFTKSYFLRSYFTLVIQVVFIILTHVLIFVLFPHEQAKVKFSCIVSLASDSFLCVYFESYPLQVSSLTHLNVSIARYLNPPTLIVLV